MNIRNRLAKLESRTGVKAAKAEHDVFDEPLPTSLIGWQSYYHRVINAHTPGTWQRTKDVGSMSRADIEAYYHSIMS
jgi:hypothetical protein